VSPFCFNGLLADAGVPINETILLRHQKVIPGRPTPYSLWRDDRSEFERFQSYQNPAHRSYFSRPYWASFVVTPAGETLFVGLYASKLAGAVRPGMFDPVTGLIPGADKPDAENGEPYDLYECLLDLRLSEFDGRLVIDWGRAHRSWGQVAANQNKEIIELRREVSEAPFPGYLHFVASLSEIATLPASWQVALGSVRGIYLLTCPKTKEQYVGKASGSQGFWGRWLEYFQTGHGGNIGLKSRDPSDYQVSILEVCGSSLSERDLVALESLWKMKLQSREMGLNRN
jgi:hypothetical protein